MKQVKICGLFREEDIITINQAKPDYCGFIINFPKSHRNIDTNKLIQLTKNLDKKIKAVGVFVDQPIEIVSQILNSGHISIAQLHGNEDNIYISELRKQTDSEIWQAFQINTFEDVRKAMSSDADFILLDAGKGSGHTFNWEYLKEINRPFGLAGGIRMENLEEALKTNAKLLDISGGVETDKLKDEKKIFEIIQMIRQDR